MIFLYNIYFRSLGASLTGGKMKKNEGNFKFDVFEFSKFVFEIYYHENCEKREMEKKLSKCEG